MLGTDLPRRAALLGAAALLLAAAPAQAEVTGSQVTSPADGTRLFTTFDQNAPEGATETFTVQATVEGTGLAQAACRYGSGNLSPVGPVVDVTDGTFSADVRIADLWGPCRLVVVPSGAESAGDSFSGPIVHAGYLQRRLDGDRLMDYYLVAGGRDFSADYVSFGSCGLYDQYLHSGADRERQMPGAYCNGYPGYQESRAAIRVDGRDAFDPRNTTMTGAPALGLDVDHDPVTGDVTIDEIVPLSVCPDEACASLVPSGVELHRRTLHRNDGQVIVQQDAWRSTDGAAHGVDYRTWDDFSSGEGNGSHYLLPGQSDFATQEGDVTIPGSGPASLLVRSDAHTGETDPLKPYTGVTFSKAPGALTFVNFSWSSSFWQPLDIAVPATGSARSSRVYTIAAARGEIDSLVAAAEGRMQPAVTIDAPAQVDAAVLTLKGTVVSDQGTPEVTVNGNPAKVDGDKWSLDVALAEGNNAFEVVAKNAYGYTAKAGHTVRYVKPVVPPVVQPPVVTPPNPLSVASRVLGTAAALLPGADLGPGVQVFAPASSVKALKLKAKSGRFDRLVVFCAAACELSGSGKLTYSPPRRKARAARAKAIKVRLGKVAVPAGQARVVKLSIAKRDRKRLKRVKKARLALSLAVLTAGQRTTDKVSVALRVR